MMATFGAGDSTNAEMDQAVPGTSNNLYEVLYDRERAELDGCLKNIALFSKYIRDYESLRERLTTLADKTSHDIMVPIAGSKLAFMPGYIHHTNEVLVLIGDNYFVEKSAKEAIEFVDRRVAFCRAKIEELEKQQTMLQNWLGATADMKISAESGQVDITETWTEEELQRWKVKHRQSVQEHRREESTRLQSVDINIDQILSKYEREEEEMEAQLTGSEAKARQKPPGPLKAAAVEQQLAGLSISEKGKDKPATAPLPSSSMANNLGLGGDSSQQQPQRPISKFKASRMKK